MKRLFSCALCLAIVACGNVPTYEYGPGPDADILATSGAVDRESLPYIRCSGPEDEIALLGSLCTGNAMPEGLTSDVADRSFIFAADWLLDHLSLPKLLLYGYHTAETAPDGDHAEDIRWAAVIVFDSPVRGSRSYSEHVHDTLASWPNGEPLSGAIVTQSSPEGDGCAAYVIVEGTLLWRSTTIAFGAELGPPC